jgi:UDP-N-acetylmuramoyl-L-alanyl-D-glutamate--2,6-diaminopimelate ligase
VRLSELIAAVPDGELEAGDRDPADVEVGSIELDSRRAGPGSLFCCIRGERTDGHDHAPEAVSRGAVALLVERPLDLAVPQLVVADSRVAMAPLAVTFHRAPSRSMSMVGVTGTNGKTTTTFLLRSIFVEAGRRAEVLGTLSGARTTPEAPELQATLASLRDGGVEAVAMEVSSHALAQHRVDGTWFEVVVFTNLSPEHLDYHDTMDAYFDAKARLFTPAFAAQAVIDVDSPWGTRLLGESSIPTTSFSIDAAEDLVVGPTGSTFRWRGESVALGLGGQFNVANALAAAEAAHALGIPPPVVAAGLSQPLSVPGRFEIVDAGQPFTVIVDYAHTPDGLEQLLAAARAGSGQGEVTVVFGCGGDRDAAKRPTMGEVAATGADRVVLTSDNSRGEPTGAIIDAVKLGYDRATSHPRHALVIESDRRAAIAAALGAARPGDVVVIAGKGHETTQTIGDVVTPFDDREVARRELERLGGGPA